MTYAGVTLDVGAHVALVDSRPLDLSHLQFVILAALVRAGGRVVPTSELVRTAATVITPSSRTVPAVISRLRRALLGAGGASIALVRSRGYRLVPTSTT